MPSFWRSDIVLVRYPFSDLTSIKVRPAIVVNAAHASRDLLIVPLTSKTGNLLAGEFVLNEWRKAGLNVPSAVKRGIYTVQETLVSKRVGRLASSDEKELEQSLRNWLGLN